MVIFIMIIIIFIMIITIVIIVIIIIMIRTPRSASPGRRNARSSWRRACSDAASRRAGAANKQMYTHMCISIYLSISLSLYIYI